jgi:hypothetical protein
MAMICFPLGVIFHFYHNLDRKLFDPPQSDFIFATTKGYYKHFFAYLNENRDNKKILIQSMRLFHQKQKIHPKKKLKNILATIYNQKSRRHAFARNTILLL